MVIFAINAIIEEFCQFEQMPLKIYLLRLIGLIEQMTTLSVEGKTNRFKLSVQAIKRGFSKYLEGDSGYLLLH